jgi:hypothetical protein
MSAEVSPLLKPLLERDIAMEEAQNAIEGGDFVKAVVLFEKISDFCLDLGDDMLGKEFNDKAQKIKGMLAESGTEIPESIERLEEARSTEESVLIEPSEASVDDESVQISSESPQIKPLPGSELILNPEDFMVKAKPKRVINVPEDAKNKLSTSAYVHVENPPESKPKKREAVSPTALFDSEPDVISKPTSPPITEPLKKTEIPELQKPVVPGLSTPSLTTLPEKPDGTSTSPPTTSGVKASSQRQIADIEKSLMELKIKKANISKMSLDFEMKELTGEISTEEYDEKIKKLQIIEKKIKDQIAELELLL